MGPAITYPGRARYLCRGGAMMLLLMVSACSSAPDLRYQGARQFAPLEIPGDLDRPVASGYLEIPASQARVTEVLTGRHDEAVSELERPPVLLQGL